MKEVLLMDTKISYGDFSDKDVVSGLERILCLDKSQFEDLPEKEVKLKSVRVVKLDNDDKSERIDNIRYYDFTGENKAQREAVTANGKKSGMSQSMIDGFLRLIPKVKFRVEINDSDGKLLPGAQERYNFLVENGLIDAPNNQILSNLNYGVTWRYLDAYHNVLGLVVPDFKGVKVANGKK